MDTSTLSANPINRRNTRSWAVLGWLRLARVFQKVDRLSADELRAENLSVAQFDVLAHVGSTYGPTQQELADSLLVTKGNVCQLLDRMEKRGLLERRQDGRANRLFLTDCGRALYTRVVPNHEFEIDGLFAPLTRAEQLELLRLLRKLDRSLR
ncbi:MAG: MarR family winged helix-turn-helix transcriptional regulator [Chloroflexota bacterium]